MEKRQTRSIYLLVVSLTFCITGLLINSSWILSMAGAAVLAGLALLGGAPLRWVLLFWGWTGGVFCLLHLPNFTEVQFIGLPLSVWIMLAGMGVMPILIWPLGFFVSFRDWMGR